MFKSIDAEIYNIVKLIIADQNSCLNFWKLVNLTGLKAVEHFAIVMLFLEIESVM